MTSTELQTLLERVEKATGPNRKIDALLWPLAPDFTRDVSLTGEEVAWREHASPRYTASLDAALALVERVLPGWTWDIGAESYGASAEGAWARVYPRGFMSKGSGNRYAKTPTLALLAALLRALTVEPK